MLFRSCCSKIILEQHNRIQLLEDELNRLNGRDRSFTPAQKNIIWEQSNGLCDNCGVTLSPFKGESNSFEADHIIPFSKGGYTNLDNGTALCRTCNRTKSNKE